VRHAVLQLDDFLPEADVALVLQRVLELEPKFVPSSVSDAKVDYRHSLAMDAPADIVQLASAKIRARLPAIIAGLRMTPLSSWSLECQLTANNDGSYFRIHTDSSRVANPTRLLTFVYYFNHPPKGFEGGELRVYDDHFRNGKFARAESFQVVQPRHNSIVFFQSALMHEVTPVRVASKLFRDSRFTVNGWIHRA
jgi:SM-20-related protein